jgi:hypothetical protein
VSAPVGLEIGTEWSDATKEGLCACIQIEFWVPCRTRFCKGAPGIGFFKIGFIRHKEGSLERLVLGLCGGVWRAFWLMIPGGLQNSANTRSRNPRAGPTIRTMEQGCIENDGAL